MKRELGLKKLTAMFLTVAMVLSLAACGNTGSDGGNSTSRADSAGNSSSADSSGSASTDNSGGSDGGYKQYDGKIVLWTLAKDLQQFADRYREGQCRH